MIDILINKRKAGLLSVILVLGFSGIAAQTVLLREMLVLFSGNEFSLGIIIGSWVICEAAGALTGGSMTGNLRPKAQVFTLVTLFFSVVFPLTIYCVRIFKTLAGIPPGLGTGIVTILWSSFLILLPVGFIHGFLFILACSLRKEVWHDGETSAGAVYTLEMLGTIAGGIIVSYLLVPRFDSFRIALLTLLINSGACFALLLTVSGKRWISLVAAGGLSVLATVLLVAGPDRLQELSVRSQWRGNAVVAYRNSFYGNITVVSIDGQHTFFVDGLPRITTPVPDIASAEDRVHFTMLSHPSPENILVLGCGAGGVIGELLKYRTVKTVDYVETDPLLLKTIMEFPSGLTHAELSDPRVHLHFTDGRKFVREAASKYDVVLLGVTAPATLQANRFFTREFFGMIRNILSPEGLFSFAAPGTLTYYNRELKAFNACMVSTLGVVFPSFFVIPGDTNIFIASGNTATVPVTPAAIYEQFKRRKITASLITPGYLEYRLDRGQRDWFLKSTGDAVSRVNTDFSPEALFSIIAWNNIQFTPSLGALFNAASRLSPAAAAAVATLAGILFLILSLKWGKIVIPCVIATSGFASMLFELLLVFAFQVHYGFLFHQAGLLITVFMGGLAAGSFLISHRPAGSRDSTRLLTAEAVLLTLAILLCLLFQKLDLAQLQGNWSVYPSFLGLLFLSGLVTGIEFPLANRIYSGRTEGSEMEQTAGLVYGADLLGAWLGGVLGGFILLPVLGFAGTCGLVAMLKLFSLTALALSSRNR